MIETNNKLQHRRSVYEIAIKAWGVEDQLRMAQEKCGELIVAVAHILRKGKEPNTDSVIDEIADVEVMMEQLRYILGDEAGDRIDEAKERKVARVREKLSKDGWNIPWGTK